MSARILDSPAIPATAWLSPEEARAHRELLEQLEAMNGAAWRTLYLSHRPLVRSIASARLGYGPDVEEVTQQVFATAAELVRDGRAHLHGDPGGLRAWLAAITLRVAHQARRQQRSRDGLTDPAFEATVGRPGLDVEARRALTHLQQVLRRMPEHLSDPWHLRHIERMSLLEIAKATGVSLATVKRRLREADTHFDQLARRDPVLAEYLDPNTPGQPVAAPISLGSGPERRGQT